MAHPSCPNGSGGSLAHRDPSHPAIPPGPVDAVSGESRQRAVGKPRSTPRCAGSDQRAITVFGRV
jgi:hypothetical protein